MKELLCKKRIDVRAFEASFPFTLFSSCLLTVVTYPLQPSNPSISYHFFLHPSFIIWFFRSLSYFFPFIGDTQVQTDLTLYRSQESNCDFIPFYSARGCCQTLEPINPIQSFRALKGNLVSFNEQSQLKYASVIECKDVHPIALDDIWPGMQLWVECICLLITPQITQNEKIRLKRPPVNHSLWVHPPEASPSLLPEDCFTPDTQEVLLPLAIPKGHISYRPRLHMMVEEFSIKTHEWEGETGWKMKLIEI